MNELMTKDNEWIIHFMGSLDPTAGQLRATDCQLSPYIGRRAFLHRQGSVGTIEGKPSDTPRLSQRGTDILYPVGRQDTLPRVGHRENAA